MGRISRRRSYLGAGIRDDEPLPAFVL
ncbi:hypothetical protein A2U01_0113197, partial [Trifolium medium]|nr:hypothetical protein [Trifolium medium]